MKRKANALDEKPSWDSWSPSSDSSTTSDRLVGWEGVGTVPWTFSPSRSHIDDHINFRTKKRVRNNRPDLDAIHQNTLAKLYGAQRQHEMPVSNRCHTETHNTHGPNVHHSFSGVTEPTQRSLHSFFNIGQRQGLAKQVLPSTQQRAGVMLKYCEDCGNGLDQSRTPQSHDAQMMDVDRWQEPSMDEDYECAVCSRDICDTCAVRGDRRICLECAMPGGG